MLESEKKFEPDFGSLVAKIGWFLCFCADFCV